MAFAGPSLFSLEVNSSPSSPSSSPTAAVRQHLHMLPRGYQFLIVNLAVKMTFVVLINQIQGRRRDLREGLVLQDAENQTTRKEIKYFNWKFK